MADRPEALVAELESVWSSRATLSTRPGVIVAVLGETASGPGTTHVVHVSAIERYTEVHWSITEADGQTRTLLAPREMVDAFTSLRISTFDRRYAPWYTCVLTWQPGSEPRMSFSDRTAPVWTEREFTRRDYEADVLIRMREREFFPQWLEDILGPEFLGW